MRVACINAVGNALGRAPTTAEARGIEDRVKLEMRLLATKDPAAWSKMTAIDQLQAAAKSAAAGMIADVQKQQQRVQLSIAAHDRIENWLSSQTFTKPGQRLKAVSQLLDWLPGSTNDAPFSVASRSLALLQENNGKLIAAWEASHPKFFGLFENAKGIHELMQELWGHNTGNAAARAGADTWRKVTDDLRDRFNSAGGDVGKLDEWHYPQHHDQGLVAKAGLSEWLADILPKMDRSKYINLDGSRMRDDQVTKLLTSAYDSIVTEGRNSLQPGTAGYGGMIAGRGAEHRAIFFKDADSFIDYQAKYGGRSLYRVLTGHVARISRDIALTESLGPNPEAVFNKFNDQAMLDEVRANPLKTASLQASSMFNQRLFDYLAGRNQVVNQNVADRFQALRNWMTATKLGKVVITALSDEAGMAATSFANRIPYSEVLLREAALLNPAHAADRRILQSNGLGLSTMVGGLNRFAMEELGSNVSGKAANAVLHISGAEPMWDIRRQALGSTLMTHLADLVKEHPDFDSFKKSEGIGMLGRKGMTKEAFDVWKLATPEQWRDRPVLTPQAISAIPDAALAHLGDPTALRREATTQLLAHTLEEAGMGAMDTGPRQRVMMSFGTTRGTVGGELARSAMLFKSFAFSMMTKHWTRMASMPGFTGKAAYAAPLVVYGTLIAAAAQQLRNLVAGQNPANIASPKFWGAAFLRGGGLGYYGDFLYSQVNGYDHTLTEALGGPVVTGLSDIYNLTAGAAFKHAQGQKVDELAKVIRFGKDNIPFLNMWYTQAAFEHLVWMNMQDAASPGYLDRMQSRMNADKGTSWYWQPGTNRLDAPDMQQAWQPEHGKAEAAKIARNLGAH